MAVMHHMGVRTASERDSSSGKSPVTANESQPCGQSCLQLLSLLLLLLLIVLSLFLLVFVCLITRALVTLVD